MLQRLSFLLAAAALWCGSTTALAQEPVPVDSTAAAPDTTPPAKPKRGRATPPRQLDPSVPNLRFTGRVPSSLERSKVFLEASVMIGVDGTPDLASLRLAGPGASENRDAVVRWLEQARFEPARDADGNPRRAEIRVRWSAGG